MPALEARQGRMAIIFIVTIVGAYLVLVGTLYIFQRNLLYLPSHHAGHPAARGVPEMTEVMLRTADGLDLLSWYRPAVAGHPTLVYFHGNGGDISYRAFRVRPYLDSRYGLLLVEYRGYGGNPGKPDEQGLYADGRAAMVFLAADGVAADQVVIYGESLGSGVAVHIAAELGRAGIAVGAVILEAPMSSLTDVAAYHYPFVPVRWLLKDRFDSAAKIDEMAAPLFIIHGEDDRVVPVRFGRVLFDAAREPKEGWWIPGGGHEDLHRFGLQAAVLDYVARHLMQHDRRPES